MTVLINQGSGTAQRGDSVAQLHELLATRLPGATTRLIGRGDDVTEQARAARNAGAQIVVAAGGDGTTNAVVQAVAQSDVRLGLLPLGTLNHFARDVGVPSELSAAVDLLARGAARRVDVGEVNGRYFVNNASLGLYPELVDLRERQDRAWPKPLRLVVAMAELVRTARPLPIELRSADTRVDRRVWLLFVGNNRYQIGMFPPARRARLDAGELDVVVIGARRRAGIVPLVLRTLLGRARAERGIGTAERQFTARPLGVEVCRIAFDGEESRMAAPFVFRSIPQALSVIGPGND